MAIGNAVSASDDAERPVFADGSAFIDGQFVPIAEARIPIMDWGFLRSDATYDVVHVWEGHFFRLDDHLDRFLRGVERLNMSLPYDRATIVETLTNCVRLGGLRDAYVEMICTRGVPPAGSRDPRRCVNRFYAFAVPFVWIADPAKQEVGLDLVVSTVRRIPPDSVDPTIKNYHWLDLTCGLFDAYSRGGETAVLVDRDGHVIEGPGFNIFSVSHGGIATPDRGVLEGITRRTVIELAARLGVPLEQRPVSAEELERSDEAFVSSTAGGVMPVCTVNGRKLGDGSPGAMTRRIRTAYWNLHRDPRYATPVSYD